MEAEIINMGVISIIPALIAIVLSFATRNTIVSLVVACIVGTLLSGQGLLGFPTLLKTSLGTTSFSWVHAVEYFYRYHRCIFSEDRSNPELLSDDPR